MEMLVLLKRKQKPSILLNWALTPLREFDLHRRHLTTSQRAMVAVEVEKVYAEEAKQRQIRKPESVVAILPQQNKGKARDKAAEMLNIGHQR